MEREIDNMNTDDYCGSCSEYNHGYDHGYRDGVTDGKRQVNDYYKRLSEAAVEYLYLMNTPDEISLRKLDKARLKYESIIKEGKK